MKPNTSRRKILSFAVGATAFANLNALAKCPVDPLSICNVTHLNTVKAGKIVTIQDTDQAQQALKNWRGKVSVGGGRFSMGGQTAIQDGLQLDMRPMNKILGFDPKNRTARVQAGMRWRDLQEIIDPHGLAIQTMQSYSNFTVGGSVSVNCHGRYVGHGPVIASVRSLKLVLPYGEALEVSRQSNSELFHAAIGGYGGAGVITEVELDLDENFKIERTTAHVSLEDYPAWFQERVLSDPNVLLHNADLLPSKFDKPRCVTWSRSEKTLTIIDRLRPIHGKYAKEKLFLWALSELPGGSSLREKVAMPMEEKPAIVWRNYEASLDVAELEPATRNNSTYVLQEYFIPAHHFANFAKAMSKLMQAAPTGTINVSIRHSPADRTTLMSWAQQDVFSFVVYYKQGVSSEAARFVGNWTRSMIQLALTLEGSYYLPYQLHATQDQFLRSYPAAAKFKALRKQIDGSRLTNMMWEQYQI